MRLNPSIAAVPLALLFCGCAGPHPQQSGGETHPVVSVEQTSDMFYIRSKKTGLHMTPGVDIFADGKCNVRTFHGAEFTKTITRSKLEELLHWLEGEGLFSISEDVIERRIRETSPEKRVVVVDSGYTRLAAQQGAQTVKLSRYALDAEIENYPEVSELRTIQKCVDRVYATVGTK